jgi:hypothetical protein
MKSKKVGSKITLPMKLFLGWIATLFLLLLLFGPMILFSSLNPITNLNKVKSATLEMGVLIDN